MVAPTSAVAVRPKYHRISVAISITGGTARTAQLQGAFTDAGPWFNIGTSRTTTGDFLEDVPAVPFLRLNITANTGSSVSAWAYTSPASG